MFLTYLVTYGKGYGDNTSRHFLSQDINQVNLWIENYVKDFREKYKITETYKDTFKLLNTEENENCIVRSYKYFDLYFDIKTIVL